MGACCSKRKKWKKNKHHDGSSCRTDSDIDKLQAKIMDFNITDGAMEPKTLNEFLLLVTRSLFSDIQTMDKVVGKTLTFAQKLIKADRYSLFLVDHQTNELYARICNKTKSANHSWEKSSANPGNLTAISDITMMVVDNEKIRGEPEEIRFPMDKGIAGYVATTGHPCNIKDAYKDSRFNKDVDARTGYVTQTILCMPIKIRGKVIGVVQMINKVGEGGFTDDDELSFEMFATYCGLALHQAQLYEKIYRSEQKFKVALEVLCYHATCTDSDLGVAKQRGIPKLLKNIHRFDYNAWGVPYDDTPGQVMFMFQELFNLKCNNTGGGFLSMLSDITTHGSKGLDIDDMWRFTLTIRKNYRKVPYHNWEHAFSVAQCMFAICTSSKNKFTPVEVMTMYVACLCHDLDHRGKTNAFMVQSASPLAAVYTTSTMEHHHFNQAVTILQADGHNIFKYLGSKEYKNMLGDLKKYILATDLVNFFKFKGQLAAIVEKGGFSWDNSVHRDLAKFLLMTACDLCAMVKPWAVQKDVVVIIMEEFWLQGDEEKKNNIKPMDMMNRDKKDEVPQLEIGFISGVCMPCYDLVNKLLPDSHPLMDGCSNNLQIWKKIAADSTKDWTKELKLDEKKK